MDEFYPVGRPRDIVGGTLQGVEDIGRGVAFGGACLAGCAGAICQGEYGEAVHLAGGAVLCPLAGAVVGAGDIIVGAVSTVPAMVLFAKGERFDPTTREWKKRTSRCGSDGAFAFTGRPKHLVGRLIRVRGEIAMVTAYHPAGFMHGNPGVPGQHSIRYESGPSIGQNVQVTLRRACKKARIFAASRETVGDVQWHLVSEDEHVAILHAEQQARQQAVLAQSQAQQQAQQQAQRQAQRQALHQARQQTSQWQVDLDGTWVDLPKAENDQLEAALRTQASCRWTIRNQNYHVDWSTLEQVNDKYGTRRSLRRHWQTKQTGSSGAPRSTIALSLLPFRFPATPLVNSTTGRPAGLKYSVTRNQLGDGLFSREALEFNFAAQQLEKRFGNSTKVVQQVDFYDVPLLETQFQQKITALQQASYSSLPVCLDQVVVFHGTNESNIESIMQGGFQVGGQGVPVANGTRLGQGVYTSTSARVPDGYSHPAGTGGASAVKKLIMAVAVEGKLGGENPSRSTMQQADSWRDRGDSSIIVFKDGTQLLPRWVVHYQ